MPPPRLPALPDRRQAARRSASGFTLVEVLVALFILALLAGLAWRGIDSISRTREASQQRLEALLRTQTVLAQWDQDLAMLQDSLALPALQFDGATLRITRRQEAGLQVVAWSLREGRLYRWAGPVVTRQRALQDQWLQSQQLMGNEPGQLLTLSGIAQWQLYCWRGNAWSNCQSSGDVASPGPGTGPGSTGSGPVPPGGSATSSTSQTLLPTGLRLVLGFAEGAAATGSLTRDVALAPM